MLLKISDGSGGWVYFDRVDRAYVASNNYRVKALTELGKLDEGAPLNLISKDCFRNNKEIDVGVLEFEMNGSVRRALFTNLVFVCNDNGDTIDRLTVSSATKRRNFA